MKLLQNLDPAPVVQTAGPDAIGARVFVGAAGHQRTKQIAIVDIYCRRAGSIAFLLLIFRQAVILLTHSLRTALVSKVQKPLRQSIV